MPDQAEGGRGSLDPGQGVAVQVGRRRRRPPATRAGRDQLVAGQRRRAAGPDRAPDLAALVAEGPELPGAGQEPGAVVGQPVDLGHGQAGDERPPGAFAVGRAEQPALVGHVHGQGVAGLEHDGVLARRGGCRPPAVPARSTHDQRPSGPRAPRCRAGGA